MGGTGYKERGTRFPWDVSSYAWKGGGTVKKRLDVRSARGQEKNYEGENGCMLASSEHPTVHQLGTKPNAGGGRGRP